MDAYQHYSLIMFQCIGILLPYVLSTFSYGTELKASSGSSPPRGHTREVKALSAPIRARSSLRCFQPI